MKTSRSLRANSGNQGELLVVAPTAFWNSADCEEFRDFLAMLFPGLPAPEPLFNIIEVKSEGFSDVFKSHRNILMLTIDPTDETKVEIKRDVYARQQAFTTIKLRSISDLGGVIETQLEGVMWYFHKADVDRMISRNKAFGSKEFNSLIATKTGLNMVIQEDFEVAKEEENFIWLRLDRQKPIGGYQHDIRQGLMIYSRPYSDTSQFSLESLYSWKSKIDSMYIEGPSGSHMSTSTKVYQPEPFHINFLGNTAVEIRGLWRMEGIPGVHMGGPFYALAFYNPNNQRQYMIEGYVYGPQFNKTAFVREVEAIAKSATPVELTQ